MTVYDPTDTQAQAQSLREADERSQQLRWQEEDDLRWLMADQRGRRIAWRWLERAGLWRMSFNPDALTMAFREGSRNQGLMLLDLLLAACPDFYATMMEEAHEH